MSRDKIKSENTTPRPALLSIARSWLYPWQTGQHTILWSNYKLMWFPLISNISVSKLCKTRKEDKDNIYSVGLGYALVNSNIYVSDYILSVKNTQLFHFFASFWIHVKLDLILILWSIFTRKCKCILK